MHCVYSIGRNNTEVMLEYASLNDPKPRATLGDGDGIVNAESLRVCEQWKTQGHPASNSNDFNDICLSSFRN